MIKAQEAYALSLAKLKEINCDAILESCELLIKQSIERGDLACIVQPIEDRLGTEKAAIELQEKYGYNVKALQSGIPIVKDGACRYGYALVISWKYMPDNIRENYV